MRDDDIHAVMRVVRHQVKRWPEPVLGRIAREGTDPFKILIACVLSLRTKDQTTAEASHRLFRLAADPASMKSLPLKRLEEAVYPVGFYRTKAKQIKEICKKLLDGLWREGS